MEWHDVGSALTAMARRAVVEPGAFAVSNPELRAAIIDLHPDLVSKLAAWQHCTLPGPERLTVRRQMNRLKRGRAHRRSALPATKLARKIEFGDGLDLLLVADQPAARAFMERVLPASGIYEPELVGYLKRTVRPGMLMVDIGAHVGYVSCIAAALGATVVAVELQPTLVPLIQLNAAVNDLWTVHAVCAAVGDRVGLVPSMRVDPSPGLQASFGHWATGMFPLTGRNHDIVPTLTLDSMFPHAPRPDLVKIDVEGAEARVLAGASRMIAARETAFVVEVHHHLLAEGGAVLADLLSPFPEAEWRMSMLTDGGVSALTRDAFLDPDGPIVSHARNAPVLFEPVGG